MASRGDVELIISATGRHDAHFGPLLSGRQRMAGSSLIVSAFLRSVLEYIHSAESGLIIWRCFTRSSLLILARRFLIPEPRGARGATPPPLSTGVLSASLVWYSASPPCFPRSERDMPATNRLLAAGTSAFSRNGAGTWRSAGTASGDAQVDLGTPRNAPAHGTLLLAPCSIPLKRVSRSQIRVRRSAAALCALAARQKRGQSFVAE
jgi:hypothetical protein